MRDPLAEAVYRAAEYGTGNEVTWDVPDEAQVHLGPDVGTSLLDGAVITFWTED